MNNNKKKSCMSDDEISKISGGINWKNVGKNVGKVVLFNISLLAAFGFGVYFEKKIKRKEIEAPDIGEKVSEFTENKINSLNDIIQNS